MTHPHDDMPTPRPWEVSDEALSPTQRDALTLAADLISEADVLLIGAGAGASVDSGVPDFRSPNGFWKAYPPAQKLGLSYDDLATGAWFERDPEQAWGFKAHLAQLFSRASPHAGYARLAQWSRQKQTSWVYTSNIDAFFARAGFDPTQITEIHGSPDRAQCVRPCTRAIWALDFTALEVDPHTLRLTSAVPRCPHCGDLARPNVLMFFDERWIGDATRAQEDRFTTWLHSVQGARVAVLEIGAGRVVPNVRFQCERYARAFHTRLIRINPGEPEGPEGTVSLALPARRAIEELSRRMHGDGEVIRVR